MEFGPEIDGETLLFVGLDTHQPLERRPFRGFVDHAQVGDHRAAALLDATMVTVDFFADHV